ncbi:MAG: hypothetical protein IKC36_04330 [Clostridia bacterium]|nr:hypothetical protein [Clostridia bacterium]
MEKSTKFYPNREYNQKRRNKYFTLLAIFTFLILLMDVWFVADKLYWGLSMNLIIVFFIALIPKTLKENPVDSKPVLEIEKDKVCVMGKDIARSEMRWVKAIVYVGRVGNALDNRKFLEECAAGKPTLEMLGSMEVCYTGKDGKPVCEYAVCENIVEALMAILEHGKIEYRLGYSLGKDYLVSTYNVNDYMAELKSEKTDVKEKSKFKQLI